MKTASESRQRHLGTTSWSIALLAMLTLCLFSTTAQAQVAVDIGDGAGTVGDTVIVPITVDDVTGLGIFSYEIDITWPSNRATVTALSEAGTLTSPWGTVTYNSSGNSLSIVAAGATALSGSGTLLNIEFIVGPNSGTTSLTLQSVTFNEGSPTASLSNGSLSVTALPTINISPNAGQVLVGETLSFATTGGTAPYSYSSSDPLIASFAANILTGNAPGSVRATSQDFNGITDDSSGFIDVHAIRIDAGTGSGVPGDIVSVPLVISDPTAYGIISAEMSLSYHTSYLLPVGTTTTGTLAATAGWSAPAVNVNAGTVTISMAGANVLPSAGTLIYVDFEIIAQTTITTGISMTSALFNEIYPAILVGGSVSVTGFPTIHISPDNPQLVVGDTQQFDVFGGPNLPVTWGTTNGAVASMTGNLLTANAPGQTRVWVQDNIGATDTTSVFTICEMYVDVIGNALYLVTPRPVHIQPDRDVTGMGVYGYEMTVSFDPNRINLDSVTSAGTLTQSWGQPVTNLSTPGTVIIVAAGATPLTGVGPLVTLNMLADTLLLDSSTSVSITSLLFNEGSPCALLRSGTVNSPTAAPTPTLREIELEQNSPNPFNPRTEIAYEIRVPGRVRLRIYDATGSLVRTLVDRQVDVAVREVVSWNGTDDAGRKLASGIYFYRLEAAERVDVRKMVLVK